MYIAIVPTGDNLTFSLECNKLDKSHSRHVIFYEVTTHNGKGRLAAVQRIIIQII